VSRAALLVLLATACATTQADPKESLRTTLLERHAAELRRDPETVAEKLRRLARGNFPFFRGSADLYPRPPSRFTTMVALVGDPHPENVGTFPLDASADPRETIVDYNDFDQARFGPFVDDLRRLALGLFIAGDAADVAKKQRVRLVGALITGYLDELMALGQGQPPVALRQDSAFGGELERLLDQPASAGPAGMPENGTPVDPAALTALGTALVGARATLVDARAFAPAFFQIKRAWRTRGGVASFFLQRIRLVVEGPGPGADDDAFIELKETPASAALLVRLQRQLQERPDEDPLLGHLTFDGKTFRMRSYGPRLRSVSVERLAAAVKGPRWGKKDLRGFAGELGRLLARGHARAIGPGGQPGLPALLAALSGADTARLLHAETVEVTTAAAARIEQDVDSLRALLAERGPLLGWRPAAAP
jgi:hypothetical protein